MKIFLLESKIFLSLSLSLSKFKFFCILSVKIISTHNFSLLLFFIIRSLILSPFYRFSQWLSKQQKKRREQSKEKSKRLHILSTDIFCLFHTLLSSSLFMFRNSLRKSVKRRENKWAEYKNELKWKFPCRLSVQSFTLFLTLLSFSLSLFKNELRKINKIKKKCRKA